MSTETASPKLEKKSKSKDGSEKKSKKRKHQSDEAATDVAAEQVSTKKQKKSKHDRKSDAAPVSQEQGEANGATSPKKSESQWALKATTKKTKRKQRESNTEDGDTAPTQPQSSSAGASVAHVESDITEENLEKHTPFVQQTASLYLPISPMAHNFPIAGLCGEHISPHLLSYYAPLKAVMLSYSNPRLSETAEEAEERSRNSTESGRTILARSIDEYAVTFVWLTAEYLLFRPRKGTVMEGYINVQNESVLGLVCYNYFNAGIERQRMPEDWKWVGGERQGKKEGEEAVEGCYVDGEGKKVEGRVVFRVVDFQANGGSELGGGSIDIVGSLLPKEEDAKMEEQSRRDMTENDGNGGRRLGR
ncbi:hypothetical protein MBLNU230_g5481t1 [Neophaeotheca triangularis]